MVRVRGWKDTERVKKESVLELNSRYNAYTTIREHRRNLDKRDRMAYT